MAQADSKNSTVAPVVSTRRRFLSQAAGVAAGGTVLAVATIPPATAAVAPVSPADVRNAFPAMHDAANRLDEASASLSDARATLDAINEKLDRWGELYPQPRRLGSTPEKQQT